jgi:uncharacterized membrane protein
MFINITIFLLVISFLMALRSAGKLNEKPSVKNVKKGLDKSKIIFHSSSE